MQSLPHIRVLLLVNRLALGGPLIHACMLARELSPPYEIILAGGPPLPDETLPAELFRRYNIKPVLLKHLRRSINPIQDILALMQVYLLMRQLKPDLVHTHASKPGFAGRIAASIAGINARVHTFHGNVFRGYFNPVVSRFFILTERMLAHITDTIICISPSQEKELCETYKIAPKEKIRMIPVGINPPVLTDKAAVRREYGIPPDIYVVGFVGRLESIKDPLMFVEAFARFRLKTSKNTLALIIGDGSLKPAMIKRFEKHNIPIHDHPHTAQQGGAVFVSWQYPPDLWYRIMDIYALTSVNEGTPLSVMEAMSHGLPIVATTAGGVKDLIEDGKNGLLAQTGNHELFAEKLFEVSAKPSLRKLLSTNALQCAAEHFSTERMSSGISKTYRSLLE